MESCLGTTNLVKLKLPEVPAGLGHLPSRAPLHFWAVRLWVCLVRIWRVRLYSEPRGALWFPAFSLYTSVSVPDSLLNFWNQRIFPDHLQGSGYSHWTWGLQCLFLKLNEQMQKRKVCWTQWDWCEKWPLPCCNESLKNFPGICLPTWPGWGGGQALVPGHRVSLALPWPSGPHWRY